MPTLDEIFSYLQRNAPLPNIAQPPQRLSVPASQSLAQAATPMPPAPQEPGAADVFLNQGGPLGLAWWAIQKRNEEAKRRRDKRKAAEKEHGVVKKGGKEPPKKGPEREPRVIRLPSAGGAMQLPTDRAVYDNVMPLPRPGQGGAPMVAQQSPGGMAAVPAALQTDVLAAAPRQQSTPVFQIGAAPQIPMPQMPAPMPPPQAAPMQGPAMQSVGTADPLAGGGGIVPAGMAQAMPPMARPVQIGAGDPLAGLGGAPGAPVPPQEQAAPKRDWNRFLLEAGLAMMQAGGRPGTTTMGALGMGAGSALQAEDQRNQMLQQQLYEQAVAERDWAFKRDELQTRQQMAQQEQASRMQLAKMEAEARMANARSEDEYRRARLDLDRIEMQNDVAYKNAMLQNSATRNQIYASKSSGGGGEGAERPLKATEKAQALKAVNEIAASQVEALVDQGAFDHIDDDAERAAAITRARKDIESGLKVEVGLAPPPKESSGGARNIPAAAAAIKRDYEAGKMTYSEAAAALRALGAR